MIDRDFIREYIAERAEGASEALPCHWIHGANEVDDLGCDEGSDFCRECAEAKIAAYLEAHPDSDDEIGLDGGWGSDHDSQPRCDTCGAKLAGSLTDYGVDSEIEHFETYRPYECEGWEALGDAVDLLADHDPADARVSRKVLTRSQQNWAVVEAIITRDVHLSLLDILTARELDLQAPYEAAKDRS